MNVEIRGLVTLKLVIINNKIQTSEINDNKNKILWKDLIFNVKNTLRTILMHDKFLSCVELENISKTSTLINKKSYLAMKTQAPAILFFNIWSRKK